MSSSSAASPSRGGRAISRARTRCGGFISRVEGTANMRVIGDIIRLGARRNPDRAAVVMGGASVTYRQLDREANRVAHALIAAGVRPGGRVALFDFNSIDYIAIALGVAKAGATLMPVNFRAQADELAYLVADARPEVLIFGADLADIVAKAAASFPTRPALFGLRGEASGAASLEKTLERASDAPPRIAVDPAGAAALMYTSGTTGKPKGVLFPHASYFATYLALIVEGDLDPGAVTMVNIPLFHQAGMNALALPTLMMGGT
ncbi:MAG: AMP-binding protein, partial [Alphaproteobacteria bacterium]|nr:AMP-binding protein [Alphaproteobacteria bacterium]